MIRSIDIPVREYPEDHLFGVKWWLKETKDLPLESMDSFFSARLDDYPAHMERWQEAYHRFPSLLPDGPLDILDLGCGTGLELDTILPAHPEFQVTGVDLCKEMLDQLQVKHPTVRILHGDFCAMDFGHHTYDGILSFQALHHFMPRKKQQLYHTLFHALRPGGFFLNCDYFACCDEEEQLLAQEFQLRCQQQHLSSDTLVHFDIPLTVSHECDLLEKAGFSSAELLSAHAGAAFLLAKKQ